MMLRNFTTLIRCCVVLLGLASALPSQAMSVVPGSDSPSGKHLFTKNTALYILIQGTSGLSRWLTLNNLEGFRAAYEQDELYDVNDKAHYFEFLEGLRSTLKNRHAVDFLIIADSNQFYSFVENIPPELRARIRLVYDMGGGDLRYSSDWLESGVGAFIGHVGNGMNERFMSRITHFWWGRLTVFQALAFANNSMREFIEGLPFKSRKSLDALIAATHAEAVGNESLTALTKFTIESPRPGFPKPSPTPYPTFRLNALHRDCTDYKGNSGLNAGQVGECGEIIKSNVEGVLFNYHSYPGVSIEGVTAADRDFSGAGLYQSRIARSDLRHAIADDIDLRMARLETVELSGASLKRGHLNAARFADAHFSNADFSGANLKDTTFEGCSLNRAVLKNANLRNAMICKTDIVGADFSGADLTGVKVCTDQSFKGAIFNSRTKLPFTREKAVELGMRLVN